jgi:hypothetical protein
MALSFFPVEETSSGEENLMNKMQVGIRTEPLDGGEEK